MPPRCRPCARASRVSPRARWPRPRATPTSSPSTTGSCPRRGPPRTPRGGGRGGGPPVGPRGRGALVSPRSLEELAKCPFRYFLQRGLGLDPIDDAEPDPDVWLHPMRRGPISPPLFPHVMCE